MDSVVIDTSLKTVYFLDYYMILFYNLGRNTVFWFAVICHTDGSLNELSVLQEEKLKRFRVSISEFYITLVATRKLSQLENM